MYKAFLILTYLKTRQIDETHSLYCEETLPVLKQELIAELRVFQEEPEFTKILLDFLQKHVGDLYELPPKLYLSVKSLIHEENELEALEVCLDDLRIKEYLTANEAYRLGNVVLNDDEFEKELPGATKKRVMEACWFFYQAYCKGDKEAYPILIQLLNEHHPLSTTGMCSFEGKEEDALIEFFKKEYLGSCFGQEIKTLSGLLTDNKLSEEEEALIRIVRRKLSYRISLKECFSSPSLCEQFASYPELYQQIQSLLPEENTLLKQEVRVNPGTFCGLFHPNPVGTKSRSSK